ncbi:FAD:protein FMN transferase [Paenibacillus sp.]|uniref:FAD:protein FMN transferase n=1 Tax=Paenibacillus sp. TaxID=58172 RepID=UPI00283AA2C1|nr:FAD:protein FMN transferase [Paenibacillus sp.]
MVNLNRLQGIEFKAMGTDVVVMGREDGIQTYWGVPVIQWFEAIEHIASRFQSDSELSKFNIAPTNKQVKLSYHLYSMIRSAWTWSMKTDGLFQPFIGSELSRLGYNCSFEKIGTPDQEEVQVAERRDGHTVNSEYSQALILEDHSRTAIRSIPSQLDLGGMGKGWSVDCAASMLRNSFHVSKGLIDAGGDIKVWSDDEPWVLGVQSPFHEEDEWLQLYVKKAAVATSNILYRRWEYQGKTSHHHILNGKSGKPAETDIVQATVLATSVEEAEVAAKVICMVGSEMLSDWMRTHFPHLGYIAITQSGSIKINRNVYEFAERVIT